MTTWRRTLAAAGLTLALAGCWPAAGQGPNRQSWNEFETAIHAGNVGTLAEAWTTPVGWVEVGELPVVHQEPAGSPIVSHRGLVTVTTANSMSAFDLSTGARAWHSSQMPGGIGNFDREVVAAGDLVGAGYGTSRFGWSTAWKQAATGTTVSSSTHGTGLSLRGGRLAGTVSGPGRDLTQAAIRLNVGDVSGGADRWSTRLWDGPAAAGSSLYGVTLGSGQVFHSGLGLLATAPGDGALGNGLRAFVEPATGPSTCGPPGDAVYACPQWVAPLDGTGATAPMLATDGATAYTVTDAGTAYAVETATGAVLWSTPVGSAPTKPPALADGSLFVPTASGALVVLDAADGSPLWSTPTASELTVQPAVAGGVVFTGAADGAVRAFDASGCGAATCSDLWSDATGSPITGAPAVSLGKLFVGTKDGRLIAYAPA